MAYARKLLLAGEPHGKQSRAAPPFEEQQPAPGHEPSGSMEAPMEATRPGEHANPVRLGDSARDTMEPLDFLEGEASLGGGGHASMLI